MNPYNKEFFNQSQLVFKPNLLVISPFIMYDTEPDKIRDVQFIFIPIDGEIISCDGTFNTLENIKCICYAYDHVFNLCAYESSDFKLIKRII